MPRDISYAGWLQTKLRDKRTFKKAEYSSESWTALALDIDRTTPVLESYRRQEDMSSRQPTNRLPLNDVSLVQIAIEDERAFHIVFASPHKAPLCLVALTKTERDRWVHVLKAQLRRVGAIEESSNVYGPAPFSLPPQSPPPPPPEPLLVAIDDAPVLPPPPPRPPPVPLSPTAVEIARSLQEPAPVYEPIAPQLQTRRALICVPSPPPPAHPPQSTSATYETLAGTLSSRSRPPRPSLPNTFLPVPQASATPPPIPLKSTPSIAKSAPPAAPQLPPRTSAFSFSTGDEPDSQQTYHSFQSSPAVPASAQLWRYSAQTQPFNEDENPFADLHPTTFPDTPPAPPAPPRDPSPPPLPTRPPPISEDDLYEPGSFDNFTKKRVEGEPDSQDSDEFDVVSVSKTVDEPPPLPPKPSLPTVRVVEKSDEFYEEGSFTSFTRSPHIHPEVLRALRFRSSEVRASGVPESVVEQLSLVGGETEEDGSSEDGGQQRLYGDCPLGTPVPVEELDAATVRRSRIRARPSLPPPSPVEQKPPRLPPSPSPTPQAYSPPQYDSLPRAGGSRRTLREEQFQRLNDEIGKQIRREIELRHLSESLALVSARGALWVAGWRQDAHKTLSQVLSFGDQVLTINRLRVESVREAEAVFRSAPLSDDRLVVQLKRTPYARAYLLHRRTDAEPYGVVTEPGKKTIRVIEPYSPAAAAELPAVWPQGLDRRGAPIPTVLTEVNGRPLPQFPAQKADLTKRINVPGRQTTIVIQPKDFVKELNKELRAKRNWKEYLFPF